MKRKYTLPVFIIVAVLAIFCASNLFSQIQTVGLPDPGFEARIEKAVDEIRIVDTH